jgi:hypothetical protein
MRFFTRKICFIIIAIMSVSCTSSNSDPITIPTPEPNKIIDVSIPNYTYSNGSTKNAIIVININSESANSENTGPLIASSVNSPIRNIDPSPTMLPDILLSLFYE